MKPDSLAVIGLGAIGGSVAWQARLAGVAAVRGYSPEPAESVLALKAMALTDVADSPARAVQGAALVILAAPPAATLELLDIIRPHLTPGSLVSDVTSVKAAVVARAVALGLGDRFAGSHPFAGTHGSGWAHARPDRFRDAVVYVTPTPSPAGAATARQIMGFWQDVMQAHPVLMDAEVHDRQLAWTSHLPQGVAFALAQCLARKNLGGVSFGTGARDTTRLAASSPELWVDLFLLNQTPVVEALQAAEGELAELRGLIAAGDRAGLQAFVTRASEFRRQMEG